MVRWANYIRGPNALHDGGMETVAVDGIMAGDAEQLGPGLRPTFMSGLRLDARPSRFPPGQDSKNNPGGLKTVDMRQACDSHDMRGLRLHMAWVLTALMVSLTLGLAAGACARGEDISALERRSHELNKTIMCPVCPGESIDQSQNALAVHMRAIVDEKLKQGWSEDQIKAFFVEGYGASVLMEPPRRGFSLTVWMVPPVVVLAGVLALFLALRMMRRLPVAPAQELAANAGLSGEERERYFRRVRAALGHDANVPPATGEGEGGEGLN